MNAFKGAVLNQKLLLSFRSLTRQPRRGDVPGKDDNKPNRIKYALEAVG